LDLVAAPTVETLLKSNRDKGGLFSQVEINAEHSATQTSAADAEK
jgi:hypothetical protein